MADFDNLFDAAIARADETIRGYMGTSATITSGEQSGAVIRGVFDDPENISYAGQGVRVEGSSPSLFVRTDEVRQSRRPSGLRKTKHSTNSLAHRTTWLRSDFPVSSQVR